MIKSGATAVKFIFKIIQGIGTTFLGLFVMLMLVFLWIGATSDNRPSVPRGAALVLAPSGVIVEQVRVPDPAEVIIQEYSNSAPPAETSIHDILAVLERAARDDRIPGLVIFTDQMVGAYPAALHTVAEAIREFKKSGKPVYAVSSSYNQSDYLLAAQANKVYLNNYGSVLLTGYGRYTNYYKGLLDKIEANVNVFRVGTFKSAVEPFIRSDMSPAAKEANMAYMSVLWDHYISDVESAREMKAGSLKASINTVSANLRAAGGDFALLAKNGGLVDEISARHEWRSELISEFGAGSGSSFKQIGMDQYLAATENMAKSSGSTIAVITAQGPIIMGEGGAEVAAAETIVNHIRNARRNNAVKAIVLRVDSPGGSAFASELIRQELLAAKADGLPVIASFASLAASGGYWISANADEIWAQPTTITGSIGIFGMIPTFEKTLAKVGINNDGVGTTELAGTSTSRELNDTVKDLIQQNIEQGYRRFLDIVAEGRGMTPADVDKIAQGRVWAGETAKELGLVDHLGNFDDAIKAAARAAGIEDDKYRPVFYRDSISSMDQLMINMFTFAGVKSKAAQNPTGSLGTSSIARFAEELKTEANKLMMFNDPIGQYVLCTDCSVK